MKNKSIIFIIAVCLLIIVALPLVSACNSGGTATKTGTLKVGIMTPTTGVAASKGVPLRDGNLDCIDYINNELGALTVIKSRQRTWTASMTQTSPSPISISS
jgi:hypothetical protein